jgi:hypothetical protein
MTEITKDFLYEVVRRLNPSPEFTMRMAFCLPIHFELETNLPWHKNIYVSVSPDSEIHVQDNQYSLPVDIVLPNNFALPTFISWLNNAQDISPSDSPLNESSLIFVWNLLPVEDLKQEYLKKPWRKTFMYIKFEGDNWTTKDESIGKILSYFINK